MRSIISVLALLLFQSTANADSDVKPQLKAQNEAVVARTTEAQGVFMVLEDGNIKHIQSGAICIGELPNVTFWQAQIYSTAGSKGTDVGCDYARTSSDGAAVSKLTIFLVKNEGNLSLDEVFEKYRTEIKTAHPEAIAKHAALQINNTDAKSKPDYRAEGYTSTTIRPGGIRS